ncbi:MAG: hypothetical protein P8X90_16690, partial [Desulfobacterales bacterium]
MSLTRRLRKRLQKKQSSAKKARQVHLEPLEPRAGTAVDLTLRLEQINGTDMLQVIDTGSQSVLQSQALKDTDAVEIIGSDQEDTFRIDLDFDDLLDTLLLTFDGDDGADALWGPDTDNTWRLTAANEGTLNSRLSFTGIENLTGGSAQDTFEFDDGAGVDGMINGGLGVNTLDYSAYSTAVTIDLGTGAATGLDTAAFIQQFTGGTAADTLIGASNANTWSITGDGQGIINDEIDFRGFENLRGPAGNEDTFVLTESGTISGVFEGGEAGYDSLLVVLENGEILQVVPDAGGAGTADTAAFETGSRTINYTGLEPIVDQTDAANVVIHGSVLNDDLVLEDDDIDPTVTGKLRLTSLTYDFLLSDGTTTTGLAFDNPSASLAIDLKVGDDTFTLINFDPDFSAPLRVSGAAGNDTLAGRDTINDWQISGSNAGLLNSRVEFNEVENLIGGADADTFTIAAVGRLSGLFAGGGGDDSLIGPGGDTVWRISEADGGELHDMAAGERLAGFTGIENLTGGADNEDAFIFGPAGSLSGVIDGGTGGYDSLLIQAAADGSAVVVPAVADNTAVETRTYDGRTINYRKLEPFVGTAGPGSVIINGTVLDDALVLEDQNPDPAATGSLQIRSLGYEFLLAGGSTTDRLAFANPATALTIDLKAGDDTLTLGTFDPDFNASLAVSGNAGNDTLTGPDIAGTWEISGPNQGTLDTLISFAGFENLAGGGVADTFTLLTGALLSGTLAGGAGDDELIGPDTDSIWQITGAGAGALTDMVSGDRLVEFVDLENLTGGADNEDAFIVDPAGGLDGTVSGGSGGYDSLVIRTGADTIVVVPDASGTVSYDSRTISYADIEPFVDASDPANVVVKGTVLDDRLALEDADPDAVGSMQIRSTEPSYRFSLGGSLSDRIAFTNPADSLTVNLKSGTNSLTLGDFDPDFGASLYIQDFDTGAVQVERPLVLPGVDLSVSAGTITLAPGVAVSTRRIAGSDQANDASTGDSGNITLSGQTINIGTGAQLLAHVEDGSVHSAGNIELTVANTAVTTASQVEVSSRDAKITIGPSAVLRGADIRLNSAAGDEVPEEIDNELLAVFESFTIGALKTILTDNISLPAAVMIKRAEAVIEVGENSQISGSGDVIIEAAAVADGTVKAISGGFNPFTLIPVLSFSVAYSEADATAEALIGSGAVITAAEDVHILAQAEATASATARTSQNLGIGFTCLNDLGFSVAVADSDTTSKALVAEGAVISAGRNVNIHAQGVSNNVASAEVGTYGSGLAGVAVSLGFSNADVQAVVNGRVIAEGSPVPEQFLFDPLAQNINILAGDIVDDAIRLGPGHGLKTGDALVYSNNGSKDIGGLSDGGTYYAVVDASDPDRIRLAGSLSDVEAGNYIDLTLPDLTLKFLTTLGTLHSLDPIAGIGVRAELESSELSSAVSGLRGDPLIKDALLKGEVGPFLPAIMQGSMGNVRKNAPQIDWNWPLSIAGAVAYTNADNDVSAIIGESAVLKTRKDVDVQARLTDRVQSLAESVINQPDDDDNTISIAVIVGLYDNTAFAGIAGGARVDAGRAVTVTSGIAYPFLTDPLELYGPDDFASPTAIGTLLDQKLGIQSKLFNSWARSVGVGGETFGIAGAVDYLDFTNDARALIGAGAYINQDPLYRTGAQSVAIEADIAMQLVDIAGIFDINLQASTLEELKKKGDPLESLNPMGSGSDKGGFGGSAFLMFLDNTTIAAVDDGARIHTSADDGLGLHAGTTITNIALAQSGSKAGTFGISGTFAYIDHESLTLALIESGAVITGGPVNVLAVDDTNHFNLVGGVMKGNNIGIGASVGINSIDRETYAGIGNVIGAPSELAATDMNITGDLTIDAHSTGDIKVFSLAATIMTEKKIEKKDGDQNGDSSPAPLDGLDTGDPLDGVSLPALFGDAAGTPTDEDDPENPGEKKKSEGQGKTGIGIAGDVSINTLADTAVAFINDKGKITAETISLTSLNQTDLIAAAGSAAITTTGEKLSLGIAGSFSKNELHGATKSYIVGSTIEANGLSLSAARTGDLFSLTAGGALAP